MKIIDINPFNVSLEVLFSYCDCPGSYVYVFQATFHSDSVITFLHAFSYS